MNKVFKVIWSEARNAYVVVSEIAKNHGSKSCSTKKLLAMLIATGVMTCASMAPAMAADPPAEALKHSTVTAGYNITVTPKDNSDGGKEYNVDLKNDIYLAGDDADAFVNISGSKGTIWASGSVTAGSVVASDNDGNYSEITPKSAKLGQVTIDEKGNIAGANHIQTNALNAKYNLSVGTANENGTVPFFVNSNGSFYAANGKLVVDKDGKLVAPEAELGKVTADEGEIGNVVLKDGVFYKNTALRDGELYVGDADGNYSQITPKSAKLGQVTIDEKGNIAGVNSVQTNALNAKYNLSVGTVNENGTVPFFVNSNGAFYGANNNFSVDKDGKVIATAGEIGNVVLQNGVYTGHSALRDAELFVGDADGNYSQITPKSAKLGQVTIDEKGNIAGVNSIQTNALNAKYNLSVGTANENGIMPFFVNSNGAFYGANNNFSVDKDGKVTATAGEIGNVVLQNGVYTGHSALRDGELFVGDASGNYSQITTKGAKLGKVTVAEDGKISGVAAGAVTADSTDAVNGSQLYKTNQEVASNTNRINQLGSRVNKVGAGAAALAALHPMDFDPDDKLTFSAGYGNYAGENAAAIGAYYRPDEKVMFSVAGTVGNGENMVNAGVSFALDRTNHVSNSRTALAREVIDLRGQLAVMGAKMAKMEKAFGMLDETKTKLFPDVPANHWAYEYIAKLAGNGYIEGYPDGNFGGDRLMTRYEFAAMLYRAIENGAALEEKIIKEFEPELGRIRVDRISGEDGDRDKIERVRVNDTKGERDHYGNKLAK